jgi:large subunit ribosomal protein L7/L12
MSDITKEQVVEWLSAQTVLEVADLVKELEEKWGVSAAAPVAVAAAGGAAAGGDAAAAEEKDEFDVIRLKPVVTRSLSLRKFALSQVLASRKPRNWSKALPRLSRKPPPRTKPKKSRRSSKLPAQKQNSSNSYYDYSFNSQIFTVRRARPSRVGLA